MCVNYAPLQRKLLRDIFLVEPPEEDWKPETWPDYPAPIVRAPDGNRECVVGSFSIVPKSRIPPHVKKYDTANAKVETIGSLRSYAGHWKAGQLCLIPATGFFEPNYESGKPVRWRIGMADGKPFAIAGLWRAWPDGAVSFTMPTVNADSPHY
ncbi:SOS response-associated peptidase family protein [Cupriavidus basilensis]